MRSLHQMMRPKSRCSRMRKQTTRKQIRSLPNSRCRSKNLHSRQAVIEVRLKTCHDRLGSLAAMPWRVQAKWQMWLLRRWPLQCEHLVSLPKAPHSLLRVQQIGSGFLAQKQVRNA